MNKISWITTRSIKETEWNKYKKAFNAEKDIKSAIVRFESDCTCGLCVNGNFVISGTGRTPERVNCHEITSLIKKGENTVELVLGGHYFQGFAFATRKLRGFWLNQAALEIEIIFADGSILTVATDDTWETEGELLVTAQVTEKEYNTMWKNAYLWKEKGEFLVSSKVADVLGEKYIEYLSEKSADTVKIKDTVFSKDGKIIVDMGRTTVGYLEFDYEATSDIDVELVFDVTEQLKDFELQGDWAYTVNRLAVTERLSVTNSFYRNLRRRAFRYVQITLKGGNAKISNIRVRTCMAPAKEKGWFNSSDEMLNTLWEMGKYTLQVNKQQEYESCPRCEMLFFAGDGAIDALVDRYAFGESDLLKTSLSLKHEESAAGISKSDSFNRTVWQWDYFAWRIICIYECYFNKKDRAFLEEYYPEALTNILWLTERMNDRDLIFQTPAYHSTSSSTLIQVDWACSVHRLGENVFLNCLLSKALECMSELGNEIGDVERAGKWQEISQRVKNAINKHLWNEDKKAYTDSFADYVAQDGNALAVLFDVADKERAEEALNTVKERLWSACGSKMADKALSDGTLRGGSTTVSPMMSTHEAEAWFKIDKAEEGLELIRRVWGAMLKKGATTFWLFDPCN